MKRKRLLLVIAAVVLLGVLISRTRACWEFEKRLSDRIIHGVQPEIIDVDQRFSFPPEMPPDPGEAGQQTIEGIDSDHDGIRDDIQRWIYALHPEPNSKERLALRQMARVSQFGLREDFNLEERKKFWELLGIALQCSNRSYSDLHQAYYDQVYLDAKFHNTYERTKRYLENQRKFAFEETVSMTPDVKEPCENRQ